MDKNEQHKMDKNVQKCTKMYNNGQIREKVTMTLFNQLSHLTVNFCLMISTGLASLYRTVNILIRNAEGMIDHLVL